MAKKEMYNLTFVNKGKPFTVSNWNVEKHKNALIELLQNHKKASQKKLDELYRYYVILQSLKEIDETVTIKDIANMHPENLVEFFNIVYYAGKEDVHFRQGKKKSPKKKK